MNDLTAKASRPAISILVPCFNESPEVLQATVTQIKEAFDHATKPRPFEIIVIDDGSRGYDYSGVEDIDKMIRHSTNRGYGGALKTGISNAAAEWIGITDADGTYPNGDFPVLAELIPECDMVIGARPWSSIWWLRRLPKRVLTLLAGFIAGQSIDDLNSGMRIFHRSIYLDHRRIYPDAFSFSSTLTMVASTDHFDVAFVPITYAERQGTSKIHPLKDTVRFLTQILRLSLYFRPLRFFLPVSAGFAALACLIAIRDIVVVHRIGNLAMLVFSMSFQTFFFGLIAEIINKKH